MIVITNNFWSKKKKRSKISFQEGLLYQRRHIIKILEFLIPLFSSNSEMHKCYLYEHDNFDGFALAMMRGS